MKKDEDHSNLGDDNHPKANPSVINHIDHVVVDIDVIQCSYNQHRPNSSRLSSAPEGVCEEGEDQPTNHKGAQYISISMPPSPIGHHHLHDPRRFPVCDHQQTLLALKLPPSRSTKAKTTRDRKCPSQPMLKGALYPDLSRAQSARDKMFDMFKTRSIRLERQLSILRGRPVESEQDPHVGPDALPVDRYFDALEGPELDTLRPLEEAVMPEDKRWPFLMRYTISSFGICLGTSGQAILWKTISTSKSTNFLHITLSLNLLLWFISVALLFVVSSIYILKLIFYFEAVRREFHHPIRVNFFFAPFIALLFLCLGIPPSVAKSLPHPLWYVLMAPIFCLELKIYGQWMLGGQRRLSKVANPSNHLAVVGNFVGALLGATMGLKEGPLFFFAVGLAHYVVLFVTLYQRLPTNEALPKELHPVFFLFVAAPSVASMAWAKIQGSFDYGSRIFYFIALFLYLSLAVRVNLFRGIRFSLTWWAYTFPMTGASIATINYSNEVTNCFTRSLAVALCTVATLVVTGLLVTTVVHAFLLRDLFPNDIAIAISDMPRMPPSK